MSDELAMDEGADGETSGMTRGRLTPKVCAALLAVAVGLSLVLSLSNLATPSLWHDELVHVFVAKSIADGKTPQLPAGTPYYNGTTFHLILAIFISIRGMAEHVVRAPSALLAAGNVLLIYWVVRPLFGRGTALVAAFLLALSPWSIAWAREARFYTLQQGLYLATLGAFWRLSVAKDMRGRTIWGLLAVAAYVLALLTSFHSILFLGPIGLFAIVMTIQDSADRRKWALMVAAITVAGVVTLVSYSGLMNTLDRGAVFDRGGLGGQIVDDERAKRTYYVHWLSLNHSQGFIIMALAGTAGMLALKGRKGAYAALAFWVPIVLLTFFIGYRRPRFMFFAFPMYLVAVSYATTLIAAWLRRRDDWPQSVALIPCFALLFTPFKIAGVLVSLAGLGYYFVRHRRLSLTLVPLLLVLLFAGRLSLTSLSLIQDSVDAARGSHITLARRHPQWKRPCYYVREHLKDEVVITTTYLPALYYVGQVDNWYPTRFLSWEVDESGMDDLKGLAELKAYVEQNPRGYFIAEWWRFERLVEVAGALDDSVNTEVASEMAWINQNMTLVNEACSDDVVLYRWGFESDEELE